MNKFRSLPCLLLLAALAGCSSQSSAPAAKPQPKPPEFITGRSAFQQLFAAAHGWARDAQLFQLQSQPTADCKGLEGKSAVWRASFASPLNRSTRPYVWSGTDAQDAPERGVSPGSEDNYNPGNASTQVFDLAFLKIDTDQAFKVAQEHGGEKFLQKNPDTPVLYVLDWSAPTSELVWHVYYGASRTEAKLAVDVNASTGSFIRVEK
jgi:hypothetical protein